MFFIFLAILISILAGVQGWQAWSAHQRIRRIVDTPNTPMDQITDGPVQVTGVVSALSTVVESPLSKVPCVWWELHVEEYIGGKSKSWKTRVREYGSGTLLLEDDSGACQVGLERVECILEPDSHIKTGTYNTADAKLTEALAQFGFATQGWLFSKSIRCTETYLEVGDEVFALGFADSSSGDFPLITYTAEHPLLISDLSESALLKKTYNKRLFSAIWTVLMGIGAIVTLILAFV